jgi:hypothetical protein
VIEVVSFFSTNKCTLQALQHFEGKDAYDYFGHLDIHIPHLTALGSLIL